MACRPRSDPAEGPETRRHRGRGRAGCVGFHEEHRAKLHSTNPIERLNGEIKRRTNVGGLFPHDDAIVRLVGALLLEQNDEWVTGPR